MVVELGCVPPDCAVGDVAALVSVELRAAFVIGPIRLDFVPAVGLEYVHFSFAALPCEKLQLSAGG